MLDDLRPRFVSSIPYKQSEEPDESLQWRGIDVDRSVDRYSFGKNRWEKVMVSEKGHKVGIDDDDYLYFVSGKWFRARLFKIPREANIGSLPRYQYKGGDLIIQQMSWLPGGRYVIMEHKYLGLLIFEPNTKKIGELISGRGRLYGWYRS